MITVTTSRDLEPLVGSHLGSSEWTLVDAADIANFGSLTHDEHWMHVDRPRAAGEGPFGDVIAHGFYLLSLVTGLANQCYSVSSATRWTNYGLDRVRFTSPVLPGARVRLAVTLDDYRATEGGARVVLGCVLELQGSSRPALVTDWIVMIGEDDR